MDRRPTARAQRSAVPSEELPHPASNPRIAVIGVPSSLGGEPLGADRGPYALRRRGLLRRLRTLGIDAVDYRNVSVPGRQLRGPTTAEGLEPIVRDVAMECLRAFAAGRVPLVIGGDHSVSIGSIAASAAVDPSVGVLWLDAHPDFNTPETSPTGNIHGMVLAILAGLGPEPLTSLLSPPPAVPPPRIVVVGARSIDPGELANLERAGIRVLGGSIIARQSIERTIQEALAHLIANGARAVHVSVDLDVLDPGHWPGVSTPAAGGIGAEDLGRAVEVAAGLARVIAVDIAELTPPRDRAGATADAAIVVAERVLRPSRTALGPVASGGPRSELLAG